MFKALLKVNLTSLFHSIFVGQKKNQKKKSSAVSKVLIAVFAVFIVAVLMGNVGLMLGSLAKAFIALDMGWLYFSVSAIMIFLLTFIGSVFITQNLIFNAKDNELLLSMPIPPFFILSSRVLLLFALNMMYGIIMALPTIAVYLMHAGFSASTLVLFIVSSLLLLLLSSAVTCIFGWLIALISSRFKKSNIIQTVLSFALFGVYFVVCMNLQGYMEMLVSNGEIIGNAIKKAMPPFYYFGIVCSEHSLKALVALALISIIPFIIGCYIISKSFVTITAGKKQASKTKYVEKELKVSSVKSALLRKEFGKFFSSPLFILNSATGCLMQIIFTVMLSVKSNDFIDFLSSAGETSILGYIPIAVCLIMGLCASMVNQSAASISLEGSKINMLRAMPVTSDDFYYSKFMSNYIIGLPTLVACTVISCVFLSVEPLTTALMLVTLLVFFALTTSINMTANICLPRFVWNSETVVIKQSGSVMVSMLGGMGSSAVVFAPFFLLHKYVSPNIYLLCAAAVSAAVFAAIMRFVKTSGKVRFEQMYA